MLRQKEQKNSCLNMLFVHPTGSPFATNALSALVDASLCYRVVTAFNYSRAGLIAKIINRFPERVAEKFEHQLSRRSWISGRDLTIDVWPYFELLRVFLEYSKLGRLFGYSRQDLTDLVYCSMDKYVSRTHLKQGKLNAVYLYEDCAAETFCKAKGLGITCIYDLPIMFYRSSQQIQIEEAGLFPELAPALYGANEPQWKNVRKQQEIELADHIIVASTATKRSLIENGVDNRKISVIPYGSPEVYFVRQPRERNRFCALFVGRIGPRKGVHYLLQAWKELELEHADLLLVGVDEFPAGWLSNNYRGLYKWIPSVPHRSLGSYYNNADVLVFPSLVEGFGMVILEAMVCGVPVIATTNTAGADVISNEEDGFIVPIRDVESLKKRLLWCYSNRDALSLMGARACKKAQMFTWRKYQESIVSCVTSL